MQRSLAVVAALAALCIVGCGSSKVVTVVQTTAVPEQSTLQLVGSANPTSCTVYHVGNDAQVTFSAPAADVEPACQSWIKTYARAGALWTENQQPAAYPSTICALVDSERNASATVLDTGTAALGQSACAALISSGWSASTPAVAP